jgi:TetR/AcrR family transcriptional repressor of nem operon
MNSDKKVSETRQKIIEMAGRLFSERGFDGVSIREIVKAAGVNLGAVTYHFQSKTGLFAEVVRVETEPLRAIGDRIAASGLGPEARIRAMFETYAFFLLCEQPRLRIFFAEMITGGRRLPAFAVEGMGQRNEMFMNAIREGAAAGVFRPCEAEEAAWSFFGMLSSYVLLAPMLADGVEPGVYSREKVRRIVDVTLDLFMKGLLKPEGGVA